MADEIGPLQAGREPQWGRETILAISRGTITTLFRIGADLRRRNRRGGRRGEMGCQEWKAEVWVGDTIRLHGCNFGTAPIDGNS